jgi:hypothetical protein
MSPEKLISFFRDFRPEVANPRSRKEFLRPNLGLKIDDFSIFLVCFLSFCQKSPPKVNFLEIFPNAAQRPILVGHPLF